METFFFCFALFLMVMCLLVGVLIVLVYIWVKKAGTFIDVIENEHGNFKNDFSRGGDYD